MNPHPDSPAEKRLPIEKWSEYWNAGQLHSCPMAFPGNYAGEVAQVWQEFFATLTQGSRILDIGTGNGAIAHLAHGYSLQAGRGFKVTGIDAARINPAAAAARHSIDSSGIDFRGTTYAEHTGFAPGSFDAITGQYALEYTDLKQSAAELLRVLSEHGQLQFVVHHQGSRIALTAAAELQHVEFALDGCAIIERAKQLISHLAATPGGLSRPGTDLRAEELRMDLNRASEDISARICDQTNVDVLREILGQISLVFQGLKQRHPQELLLALERMEAALRQAQNRLRDLLGASQSAQQIQAMKRAFETNGCAMNEPTVLRMHSGEVMGWILRGRRNTHQPDGFPPSRE